MLTERKLRQIIKEEILNELNKNDVVNLQNIFLKDVDPKLTVDEKVDIIKPRVDAKGDVIYDTLLDYLYMDEVVRNQLKQRKGFDQRRQYELIKMGIAQVKPS
jgi:hypothetical protein